MAEQTNMATNKQVKSRSLGLYLHSVGRAVLVSELRSLSRSGCRVHLAVLSAREFRYRRTVQPLFVSPVLRGEMVEGKELLTFAGLGLYLF